MSGEKPEPSPTLVACPVERTESRSVGQEAAGDAQKREDFHLGYRRWLDGLRGLAILGVLAFHLEVVPGGFLGVDVFFVLSGFLITSLLTEEWQRSGSISLKRFYLRRGLRLLPAFFTLLLVCGLSTLALRSAQEKVLRLEAMAVAACYVTNWPMLVPPTDMSMLGHTWSLSLEEQFYVLWPVCLYGMLRWRLGRGTILLLVCAGIVACASLRMVVNSWHPTPGPEKAANLARMYMGLDTRADSLLAGCLVGLLATWNLLPKSRRFIFWTGAASLASVAALCYLVLMSEMCHSQYYRGLFTVVALMVAVILVRLLSAPSRLASFVLESTALVGVGRISYALYLFHVPILAWLAPAGLGWRAPANTLLAAVLSFAAAVLSYYCIERPCLRLKHRWQAPGAGKAAAPSGDVPHGREAPRQAAA